LKTASLRFSRLCTIFLQLALSRNWSSVSLSHSQDLIAAATGAGHCSRDKLMAAGATVDIVSLQAGEINGWDKKDWGRPVKVDKTLGRVSAADYDAIALPDGRSIRTCCIRVGCLLIFS
jgi:hypothetical protein